MTFRQLIRKDRRYLVRFAGRHDRPDPLLDSDARWLLAQSRFFQSSGLRVPRRLRGSIAACETRQAQLNHAAKQQMMALTRATGAYPELIWGNPELITEALLSVARKL